MQVVLHNISQEEVEEGQIQYVLHGKDHEKNRYVIRFLSISHISRPVLFQTGLER